MAVSWADVAGPSVSISPTTPPAALTRLISPAWPDWLRTVNVRVPAWAAVQSRAQPVPVTVTAVPAAATADGSAAMVTPAASAGTTTSTPATAHGRRAARRSQPGALALSGLGWGFSAGAARPARRKSGMTTAR